MRVGKDILYHFLPFVLTSNRAKVETRMCKLSEGRCSHLRLLFMTGFMMRHFY